MFELQLTLFTSKINVASLKMRVRYVRCGEYDEVIFLVMTMQRDGFKPNSRSLVAMILVCKEVAEVRLGKVFYLSFDVNASRLLFDLISVRNTI
ncbi:hypothetical protein GQ457_04G022130 [Hibiscus cannabinus]